MSSSSEASRTVLFDLDGTLTDPKIGICASVRYALEKMGLEAPPIEALTFAIGPPMHDTMAGLAGPARAHEGVRLYRERYGEIGLFENVVYDGVPGLLAKLAGEGETLYVATSKVEAYAVRILDHFGLSHFFTRIYGARADGGLSNKDELVAHIVAQEGARAQRATLIGDRLFDARAARANGLSSIAALWGYGSRAEIAGAGFDAFAETPGHAPAALAGLRAITPRRSAPANPAPGR